MNIPFGISWGLILETNQFQTMMINYFFLGESIEEDSNICNSLVSSN